MSAEAPPIGTHVQYHRMEVIEGKRQLVTYDATVIGYERAANHDPEKDGLPVISLAFPDPDTPGSFNGVNWQDGFDRVFSVPHKDEAEKGGHHFYSVPSEAGQIAALRAFLFKNFKGETGDETPVQCAIRLLSKKK